MIFMHEHGFAVRETDGGERCEVCSCSPEPDLAEGASETVQRFGDMLVLYRDVV
jgi:hypothetical protein